MSTKFEVSANGQVFGIYEADDAQGARDLCAQDAGYMSEADMAAQLEQSSELVAVEVTSALRRFPPKPLLLGELVVTEEFQ